MFPASFGKMVAGSVTGTSNPNSKLSQNVIEVVSLPLGFDLGSWV